LNLPFFIARRVAGNGQKSFSRLIIRIAIVAVALSVAVMIVASAFIAGFKQEISRKIFEFWGHIHISDARSALTVEPSPIDLRQDFYPSLDSLSGIEYPMPAALGGASGPPVRSRGGVRHIQAYALKPGIIRTKTDLEGIILKGVGKDFDWENLRPYLQAGNPIALNDSSASKEIILSRQTADRLQVGVGDKFVVHFVSGQSQLKRLFQVCGIYKTGLEEYDRKFALCDIRQTQDLLSWSSDQVAGFEVWLDDLRDMDLYNEYLYQEVIGPDLTNATIKEKFPAIFEWLELQDLNEIVLLSLMLAVAIINMITALMVLVLERTNMIGILKSLGERNRNIRQIFLYHAAIITMNGIFWGNLIGLAFCFLQYEFKLIQLNEADYYLSYAPIQVQWASVLGINIATLCITLLFLLLPSLLISRISPVKAIRFK
jgi:lipoprotein-releasing system permease protein